MQISKERITCDGNRRLIVGVEKDQTTVEIILQTRGTWGHIATLAQRPEDAQELIDDLTKAVAVAQAFRVSARRALRIAGE